jgi:LPXTG-motif cell wall-anchored protein
MSKVKRILSVIMAMVMVLAMSVPTFAATTVNPTTITVNGAKGATLKYVQIVKADATDPSGWVFADVEEDGNSVYGNAVKAAFGVNTYAEAIKALTAIGETPANKNAEAGTINNNTALATALEAITVTGNEVTANNDSYVLTDKADAGLYVIVANKEGVTYNRMLAYVAYNDAATALVPATVTAKGSEDQIKKVIVDADDATDTGSTVMKGDRIDYKITTEYPYYPANAESTTFVIKDTLENATFDETVPVTVAGVPEVGYTITFNNDKTEMTITFDYDSTLAGTTVEISYAAIVGEISNGEEVKNAATSTTEKGYTIAEVNSPSAEFTVIKVDEKDQNKKINGAEFTLYVADENGAEKVTYNGETIKVRKVEAKTTTGTTKAGADEGKVTFKGLDAEKDYYVVETKAPAGYSINNKVYKLSGAELIKGTPVASEKQKDTNDVEFTKLTTTNTVTNFNDQTVTDTKLSSLPSTGGIGTTIFTIGGCAIMIVAAGLFFATRRKTQK